MMLRALNGTNNCEGLLWDTARRVVLVHCTLGFLSKNRARS
jgi:hypothetical protein